MVILVMRMMVVRMTLERPRAFHNVTAAAVVRVVVMVEASLHKVVVLQQ